MQVLQSDAAAAADPHFSWSADAAVATRQHQQLAPAVDQQADLIVDLQQKPSIPSPVFKEVFTAHDDSPMCPQMEHYNNTIGGTLDCLNLNIYVPHSASFRNRLPVLLYVFGDRYKKGFVNSNVFGSKFLVKHDIIFVSLNCRLGPYGFMCLDTPQVPGNQGLKDQIHAMKWIKENIAAFGGDPDRITLWGTSSGRESVDLHVLYGPEELLFNNVIIQSRVSLSPFVFKRANRTIPLALAHDLGFPTSNLSDALSFLANQNVSQVIGSSAKLGITYGPCIEEEFEGVSRFITDDRTKDVVKVKKAVMLVQQSNSEAIQEFANNNMSEQQYLNIFKDKLKVLLNDSEHGLQETAENVRIFYIGNETVSNNVKQNVMDFLSDLTHYYPTKYNMQKYLRNGVKKLYSALFSFSGMRNYNKKYDLDLEANQADELSTLFDKLNMKGYLSDREILILERITTLWTNFVKFSDPTPETNELLPVKWMPVTNESLYYLNIDSKLSLERNLYNNRMAFWDLLFKTNHVLQNRAN